MDKKAYPKKQLLYLLGAGRSGTTLLATVLNAIPEIQTLGEVHQFLDYIEEDKRCSCGKCISRCPFWKRIVAKLPFSSKDVSGYRQFCNKREAHHRIPYLLKPLKSEKKYLQIQEMIFEVLVAETDAPILLDSSKYIARFLMLRQSAKLQMTGIYMVRDVRGVVESFNKKVQTPKKPWATIFYYLLINFFGELVYRWHRDVVKVKYEDFLMNPQKEVARILRSTNAPAEVMSKLPEQYPIPHIVGGNRLKANREIRINPSVSWRYNMSRTKQLLYYLAALPTMLVNRYAP